MAANKVMLPDGKEADASTVVCEDCGKPVSEHACGSSGGGSGVSPSPVSRSTGPRKAPQSRPPCPHCGGAIHFSMPGGLQNIECIARQYYVDKGDIADPYERLPIFGLDELPLMYDWSKTLKAPLTYGRMESAAGGAGTYAAQRPPAEKRPKKQRAAGKGERIEDIAETVEQPKRGRGRPRKQPAPTSTLTTIATTSQPEVNNVQVDPTIPSRSERRTRISGTRASRVVPTTPPVVDPTALSARDREDLARRRAERRARIGAVSSR
jgi:hypothetical protein